ncbi:hypothetical protein [Pelagibacterium lentulum]|uniref:Uncharacterized protein n=1 Tax=Pelagibacterium lentulum TaxID=2029865 RepID=A0A916W414_9HYPH|nr:hypothetical protein [Pelagibacterium lentulum]GGA64092.1 hypothetical protein GCM10011499_38140 [Pelagibacterium lentulum]
MPFKLMIAGVLFFAVLAAISEYAATFAQGWLLASIIIAKWTYTAFIALFVLIPLEKAKR